LIIELQKCEKLEIKAYIERCINIFFYIQIDPHLHFYNSLQDIKIDLKRDEFEISIKYSKSHE